MTDVGDGALFKEMEKEIMSETDKLLLTRAVTHGDFTDHARITQKMKEVIEYEIEHRRVRGQSELNHIQRESIDMILHKIGRIMAGDPGFIDHWDDIAGYAKLVSERIA